MEPSKAALKVTMATISTPVSGLHFLIFLYTSIGLHFGRILSDVARTSFAQKCPTYIRPIIDFGITL